MLTDFFQPLLELLGIELIPAILLLMLIVLIVKGD